MQAGIRASRAVRLYKRKEPVKSLTPGCIKKLAIKLATRLECECESVRLCECESVRLCECVSV